ncbi:MAG TPA: RNA 2',3'-cyclic phosphodiesterase [Ottowia sp.]|jgi:2'-5' RNA ligase|nr:RNA 2',3'-cyclic phosphodiesterase [Ottowia sp.]
MGSQPSVATTAEGAGPRRLFTALFPPPVACAAIDAERQRWAGLPRRLRPAPDRLHVTLQFHDAVTPSQAQAWQAALATLAFEPFDIALVRAELWHAPRGTLAVLRAAPSPALTALRQHTTELAAQAGLPPERRPWKPHLTALRQAEQVQTRPLAAPIRWQVDQVALIWSDLQAQPPRYHRLGAFPGG